MSLMFLKKQQVYNYHLSRCAQSIGRVVALGILLSSMPAFAAGKLLNSTFSQKIVTVTGLGNNSPALVVVSIVKNLLLLLGLVAVVLVLYGGTQWMLARGDAEAVKKAGGILRSAAIGLLVIFTSYGIALYVFTILEQATNVVP